MGSMSYVCKSSLDCNFVTSCRNGDWLSTVSRDTSWEIHLLSSLSAHAPPVMHHRIWTCSHPSMCGRNPYRPGHDLHPGSISRHPSAAGLLLLPRSLWSLYVWLQTFVPIRSVNPLLWAVFHDFLCRSVELATGPGFRPRFRSVLFQIRPKTQPALSWRGCYPDLTQTRGFLAGLEPYRGSILRSIALCQFFGSDSVFGFWSNHDMISTYIVQFCQLFHLPQSELWCNQYSLRCCEITGNLIQNSRVFDSDTTNIGRITIPKQGGGRSPNYTQSMHCWCHDTIRTQMLNWSVSCEVEMPGFWW